MQDKPAPTRHQIDDAKRAVAQASLRRTALQAAAEHAAEAYNGAKVDAANKARAAGAATALARIESSRARVVQLEASQAQHEQQVAAAAAQQARDAQHRAEAAVTHGQAQLDQFAGDAYRSQGTLGMLSTLINSADADQLLNGKDVIGRIGTYQQSVIEDLTVAKQVAAAAALVAGTSEREATRAAEHAARKAAAARKAFESAQEQSRSAAAAAAAARRAVTTAERSRLHAVTLVRQAESLLGSARATVAELQAQAAAARRAAQRARTHAVTAPSDAAAVAIFWAYKEVGTPYSWGGGNEYGPTRGFAQGADTVGFDCSGLTLFAYGHSGIHLDHFTGSQWNAGRRIPARSDLLPGDLMFFATDTSNAATIHHVSLYVGHGLMIHAPQTGEVVKVSSYGRSDFIGGVRPWQ